MLLGPLQWHAKPNKIKLATFSTQVDLEYRKVDFSLAQVDLEYREVDFSSSQSFRQRKSHVNLFATWRHATLAKCAMVQNPTYAEARAANSGVCAYKLCIIYGYVEHKHKSDKLYMLAS